jgi:hypothetical protein
MTRRDKGAYSSTRHRTDLLGAVDWTFRALRRIEPVAVEFVGERREWFPLAVFEGAGNLGDGD